MDQFSISSISLWPNKDVIQSFMPISFRDQYPSTRVIIDATEIYMCAFFACPVINLCIL